MHSKKKFSDSHFRSKEFKTFQIFRHLFWLKRDGLFTCFLNSVYRYLMNLCCHFYKNECIAKTPLDSKYAELFN